MSRCSPLIVFFVRPKNAVFAGLLLCCTLPSCAIFAASICTRGRVSPRPIERARARKKEREMSESHLLLELGQMISTTKLKPVYNSKQRVYFKARRMADD